MRKKLKYIFLPLVALSSIPFIVMAALPKDDKLDFVTTAGAQTLILNSEATPTIIDGSGTLQVNEYSTIDYTSASNLENYHVVLASGGTMKKAEATNSISSVSVTFDGTLTFESDWDNAFNGDHYVINLVSGTSYTVAGNYWKITAGAETNITSLNISYGCDNAEEQPDTSSSYVSAMKDYGEFARIEEIDGDIMFSFDGHMNGYLSSSDLTIRDSRYDGNYQYIIDAEKIEYTSSTTFRAYFNITDFYYNRDVSIDLYAHLYVRNSIWKGTDGNLLTTREGEEEDSTVIPQNNLTFDDGNKTIALAAHSWMNEGTTTRNYMPKITMSTTTKNFGIDEGCKTGGTYFSETSVTYTDVTTDVTYISKDRSTVPACDMFVLAHDNGSCPNVATGVTYEEYGDDRYKVVITFNLTLFTKYYSGSELNIWCHLRINGETWDGSNGDLKTSNTVKSTDGGWEYQKEFIHENIKYKYWNSYSMLIVQLLPA